MHDFCSPQYRDKSLIQNLSFLEELEVVLTKNFS